MPIIKTGCFLEDTLIEGKNLYAVFSLSEAKKIFLERHHYIMMLVINPDTKDTLWVTNYEDATKFYKK